MPIKIITTATTTQVKIGPGVLRNIIIAALGTSFSIQVKDGPDSNGNSVVLIGNTAIVPTFQTLQIVLPTQPVPFVNGLQIVTAGTPGEYDIQYD